ncbi:putative dihydroflavanol 4-reductase [Medicago truncatula]|uniref:Dihydroflavonol-4-reductase-like protein n=1 Tax=Medicago truncatula TaxID=3880 RepID=G7IPP8_MEDTR|nr:putative anthocyanidin reductase [Medicago truncatula]AES63793.1 dihydroflavonol-4-reductase-like protein [Medicago truncatula]RHN71915.1 putative dihydroflavanol 4-reductase [Medicago truncatula]
MERKCKVCVTGGAGYIGSLLVKKLLEKGYTVHATLRNLKDESKVGFLKGFPHANTRLVLFEADIYKPDGFWPAIQGCEFVFHVATPFLHQTDSQFKSIEEAAIASVKSIVETCIKSRTVRKLIYTGTVVASSPLKDDGCGYKDFIDETCWTPLQSLHLPLTPFHKDYAYSKTLAERELLTSNGKDENGNGGIEVVTLAVGLVGGDALLSYLPASVAVIISQIHDNEVAYQSLKFLEDIDGKIPLVHIDDVCEAHIFCAEDPSINGRFLVANSYASSAEIANYYLQNYPEFNLKEKYLEEPNKAIKWASTKLTDKGFVYKYDLKMILDDSVKCGRRTGDFSM